MVHELSPEDMRAPLRSVTITVDAGERDQIPDKLRLFANRNHFAIRLSNDPAKPGDIFVQMYRSDIKMIGLIPAGLPRLDLTVYRTSYRVRQVGIDQGVGALRQTLGPLTGVLFNETVFVEGDDLSLEPFEGPAPVSIAMVRLPDSSRQALKRKLAQFAEANGMALRFWQRTPDPKDIVTEMYGEGIEMMGTVSFKPNEFSFAIYRTGDRSTSQAAIDQAFQAFRRAIEQVPGASFALKH